MLGLREYPEPADVEARYREHGYTKVELRDMLYITNRIVNPSEFARFVVRSV